MLPRFLVAFSTGEGGMGIGFGLPPLGVCLLYAPPETQTGLLGCTGTVCTAGTGVAPEDTGTTCFRGLKGRVILMWSEFFHIS